MGVPNPLFISQWNRKVLKYIIILLFLFSNLYVHGTLGVIKTVLIGAAGERNLKSCVGISTCYGTVHGFEIQKSSPITERIVSVLQQNIHKQNVLIFPIFNTASVGRLWNNARSITQGRVAEIEEKCFFASLYWPNNIRGLNKKLNQKSNNKYKLKIMLLVILVHTNELSICLVLFSSQEGQINLTWETEFNLSRTNNSRESTISLTIYGSCRGRVAFSCTL